MNVAFLFNKIKVARSGGVSDQSFCLKMLCVSAVVLCWSQKSKLLLQRQWSDREARQVSLHTVLRSLVIPDDRLFEAHYDMPEGQS